MRLDSYLEDRSDEGEVVSPFAGLTELIPESAAAQTEFTGEYAAEYSTESATQSPESPFESFYVAESPFTGETYNETLELESAARDFLESLRDEDFEDALEELVNEGAAKALSDAQQWSVAPSEAEAYESLEQWLAPLVTEWERTIDGFAAGLENANFEVMQEDELEQLLETLENQGPFENEFFGKIVRGLANKAKSLIKRAVNFVKNPIKGVVDIAKSGLGTIAGGLKTIGKGLLGPLLNRLKKAGLGLLKGVLKKLVRPLTKLLPTSVRPFVPIITKALGIGESEAESGAFGEDELDESGFASELARAFDAEVAALMFAPEADHFGGHGESFETFENLENFEFNEGFETFETLGSTESGLGENPLAELDDARARLATQLSEYTGSESPVGPIQEFLPAILAIRPLLKLGLKVTGARDKLINLLASPLASLIRGIIGPANVRRIATVVGREPDKMIARAGVGLAFTALGLESAAATNENSIPGEALASAVEATVHRVLDELTEDEMADPLQVSAAVQRFFAESAAAYLPDGMLRGNLPELETAEAGGLWVMMPRATAPRYRFRRYSRVYRVPITRQSARIVPWSDGGTLEQYLLDLGARQWPVHAEVDLYETMPGSMIGHFTRDESLPSGENPAPAEYQLLTSEVAGVLLGESGLGRPYRRFDLPSGHPVRVATTHPGQRFYRIRVGQFPARRAGRPRRMVSLRWDPTTRRMRIAINLSERRARVLQALLQRSAPAGQRDLPAVLTTLRGILVPRLRRRIAARLVKSSLASNPAAAGPLAARVSNATMSALSAYLVQRGAQLATAVANSAEGVTIMITFKGIPTAGGTMPTPEVVAHPGWLHA